MKKNKRLSYYSEKMFHVLISRCFHFSLKHSDGCEIYSYVTGFRRCRDVSSVAQMFHEIAREIGQMIG